MNYDYGRKCVKHYIGECVNTKEKVFINMPFWRDSIQSWEFGSFSRTKRGTKTLEEISIRPEKSMKLRDALLLDYKLTRELRCLDTLDYFCDLWNAALNLRCTSEIMARVSNFSYNKMVNENLLDKIRDHNQSVKINEVILPEIFKNIENIFILKVEHRHDV